jgi:hypothetical protein
MQHRSKSDNLNLPSEDQNKWSHNPTHLHDFIMHKGMYLFLPFITLDSFVLPSYSAKEIPFQY